MGGAGWTVPLSTAGKVASRLDAALTSPVCEEELEMVSESLGMTARLGWEAGDSDRALPRWGARVLCLLP